MGKSCLILAVLLLITCFSGCFWDRGYGDHDRGAYGDHERGVKGSDRHDDLDDHR